MSISRVGSRKNSYRNFTLVLDGEPRDGVSGVMYHETRKQGVEFSCLMELVWGIEGVFEETHYPMRSVNQRQFRKTRAFLEVLEGERKPGQSPRAGLITLRLCITYRYHASWQGSVTWIERGVTESFESFLELIRWLDNMTGKVEKPRAEGRASCRVSVDKALNHRMEGRIQQGVKNMERRFSGAMDLARRLEDISGPSEREREERLITAWTMGSYRAHGKKATFSIRILFREHATWQGIICWKETGEQARFRSFLEMMLMMDAACVGQISWEEEKETHLIADEM